ncbi:MAG: tail fiber domain-containing protein, partial [Saprospiraceae bacterium]|nr:tail fiber domain-containing protein [Saprospiraceae bacterium]
TISSDRRLKQNVQSFDEGLAQIMQIRPVTYQYNSKSKYDTNPEYVGVVAQELQQVAPYMVSENEDGYLTVNNSPMTYLLINAVQEQQQLIQELTERLAMQEARLAALERD